MYKILMQASLMIILSIAVVNAAAPPAPVPKTGQTTSYAAGDDGNLQNGVAWPNPRFTDNSNGTVTDNLTGLIWLKDTNCLGYQTWASALSSATALASGQCGLTDGSTSRQWRLPSIRELGGLVDSSRSNPVLPAGHPFTSVQSNGNYWSGSTYTGSTYTDGTYTDGTYYAWYLSMIDGLVNYDNIDNFVRRFVWPVRSGQ